jgi:hypothetical protein
MPPATLRATGGCTTHAALLVVVDDTASTPPRAWRDRRKTLSRGRLGSRHRLPGLRPRPTQAYSKYAEEVEGSETQQIQPFPASQ